MKNWKTTLVGALTFLCTCSPLIPKIGHFGTSDFTTLTVGVGSLVLGALAKDHDVTGGTVKQ